MKKLLSFSLCAVMLALSLTACRTTASKEPINKPEPSISIPAEPTPKITQEPISAPEVQPMEPINIEPTISTIEVETQDKFTDDVESTKVRTDEPENSGDTAYTETTKPSYNIEVIDNITYVSVDDLFLMKQESYDAFKQLDGETVCITGKVTKMEYGSVLERGAGKQNYYFEPNMHLGNNEMTSSIHYII